MVVRATPPGVGVLGHPFPGALLAPLTGVEEDWPPCAVQGLGLGEGQDGGWGSKVTPSPCVACVSLPSEGTGPLGPTESR